MRTVITPLLFLLALAPLQAQTPILSPADACKRLEAQARKLTAEAVRCQAGPAGLTLSEVSTSSFKVLEKKLFPKQSYLGHAIVTAEESRAALRPSSITTEAQEVALK